MRINNCSKIHFDAFYCTLNLIALHWTLLQFTALYCTSLWSIALQCTALHYSALHFSALHYSTLHCTTVHCIALQCTTLHSKLDIQWPICGCSLVRKLTSKSAAGSIGLRRTERNSSKTDIS